MDSKNVENQSVFVKLEKQVRSGFVSLLKTNRYNIYDFYLFYQILLSPRTSKTDKIGFAKNWSSKPVKLVNFLVFSDLSIQFKSFSDLNFVPVRSGF
jgi:hypothetical protein